jgi:hypothetical protein
VTTKYLVDTLNPAGYSQVLDHESPFTDFSPRGVEGVPARSPPCLQIVQVFPRARSRLARDAAASGVVGVSARAPTIDLDNTILGIIGVGVIAVALGRKHRLHIDSPLAGPNVAAILSVGESCRRLKVPVHDHFSTILPRLADLLIRCLPDLTPTARVARHS